MESGRGQFHTCSRRSHDLKSQVKGFIFLIVEEKLFWRQICIEITKYGEFETKNLQMVLDSGLGAASDQGGPGTCSSSGRTPSSWTCPEHLPTELNSSFHLGKSRSSSFGLPGSTQSSCLFLLLAAVTMIWGFEPATSTCTTVPDYKTETSSPSS